MPVIAVTDTNGNKGAYLIITANRGSNLPPRLVFHRYGNQYFLAEVGAFNGAGSALRMSKAEREMKASGLAMTTVQIDVTRAH